MRVIILVLFIIFSIACKSPSIKSSKELESIFPKTTKTYTLNYEDTSKEYFLYNINEHFKIYVKIEKPYILKVKRVTIPNIYRWSYIEGTTIFEVSLNKYGIMTNYRIVKSAGLGLDDITISVLKQLVIKRAYLADKSYDSKAYVAISIREDDL